jgi:hypothetical protein
MSQHLTTIPIFWFGFVAATLTFLMVLWRRIVQVQPESFDNPEDLTAWLLFGLLLLAVFGLGALVMYVLVEFG